MSGTAIKAFAIQLDLCWCHIQKLAKQYAAQGATHNEPVAIDGATIRRGAFTFHFGEH